MDQTRGMKNGLILARKRREAKSYLFQGES
jgi:hypothetical protein